MRIWVLLFLVLAMASPLFAEDKKSPEAACQDNLRMVGELAKEYDIQRDNAIREKVMLRAAYEAEKAKRVSLEHQLSELAKKPEAKP